VPTGKITQCHETRGKTRQRFPFYGKSFFSARESCFYDDYYVQWKGAWMGNLEKAMTVRKKSRVIGTRCGNLLSGKKN